LSSVRSFAAEFLKKFRDGEVPPLDHLILNAGLQSNERKMTEDGQELTWQVNYLSQVLVVEEWIDSGVFNENSRIVFVSSGMHRLVDRLQLDDIHFEKRKYTFKDAYIQSKLAQILYMHRLVKMYPKFHFSAVEPGPVKTDIYRKESGFQQCPWEGFEDRPSPDEGAFPILYCSVESDVKSGDFRGVPDGRISEKSKEAKDVQREEELWNSTKAALYKS